jgi:hypothetical protein
VVVLVEVQALLVLQIIGEFLEARLLVVVQETVVQVQVGGIKEIMVEMELVVAEQVDKQQVLVQMAEMV